MAHFRGTIQGSRGQASRLGGAKSGLQAHLGSWYGAVSVQLYVHKDVDYARVSLAFRLAPSTLAFGKPALTQILFSPRLEQWMLSQWVHWLDWPKQNGGDIALSHESLYSRILRAWIISR